MSMILEVETNHGKRSVICDNYAYRVDHYLRGGNISWRCTQKRCKARIRTNGSLTEVLQRKNQHDHDADERKIERKILRARSKRKAVENANEKLSKIVCSELENVEKQFLHPADLKNVTKALSRLRRKHGIGGSRRGLSGLCLKPKQKSSKKEDSNSSPDLSSIIKVEPIDVDELLDNNGLEVSFCVTQDADAGASRAKGGGGSEGDRERGQGNMDIMELLQGAHQRFESQARREPEGSDTSAAGKDSGISHIPEPSSTYGKKTAGGAPVLEEMFKSARLSQQNTGTSAEHESPSDPSSATEQSGDSTGEAGPVAAPRVPAPYSLLASGGMTVEELERRQRHPFQFQQQQEGESTMEQQDQEVESIVSGSKKQELLQLEDMSQEISPTEQRVSPPKPLELLTPGDFEKSTSVSSKSRRGAVRLKGVTSPPNVLLRPQDFASPHHSLTMPASLSHLHLNMNDPPSPPCPEVDPLTRAQFQQALIHMIRTDDDFVNKLHEAYLDNFQQLRNRVTKR